MDLFESNKPVVLMTPKPLVDKPGFVDELQAICKLRLIDDPAEIIGLAKAQPHPDIILISALQASDQGLELCQQIRNDPDIWNIPVVLFGPSDSDQDTLRAFEAGASDYIAMPVSAAVLLARLKAHLRRRVHFNLVHDIKDLLEDAVEKRTQEIVAVQDATIFAMTSLAETRDSETGNHIRRTQSYMQALCMQLKSHPHFSNYLTDKRISILFKSAPMHDIGKIGIPDRILLKPGRYDADEMEIMKTHTTLGRDAIQHAEDSLGFKLDFLTVSKEIAYGHHEKWDGSGYPQGLSGEAIPISARLMAIADVYDALISKRVYKEGMSHDKAIEIIREGRGLHFDPAIVDAFLAIANEFHEIAARFCDTGQDLQKKADYIQMATGAG